MNLYSKLVVFNSCVVLILFILKPSFLYFQLDKILETGLAISSTYLLCVIFIVSVEIYFLGWQNSSARRLLRFNHTARCDIYTWIAHSFSLKIYLMAFFTVGLSYYWESEAEQFVKFSIIAGVDGFWLYLIFWWILIDILEYWFHRLSHSIAFLWEAHKFHHAATEFNVLTGARIHVTEHLIKLVIIMPPTLAIGAPPEIPLVILLVRRMIDLLQHSMLDWDYGWIGRWVLYSPIGHRIHHSMKIEHCDKNFGDLCPLWDRLFGTWYDGENINHAVGVSDNIYNKEGFLADYTTCYIETWKSFCLSVRSGSWRLKKYF